VTAATAARLEFSGAAGLAGIEAFFTG
jgi:hypothetical protein